MHIDETEELSWLSLAYLDAGIYLARAIVDDDFSNSEHRARVPLFLIHQALELVYKSALYAKCGEYPKSHDLHKLRSEFAAACPNLDFDVPEIVLGISSSNLDLFPDDPRKVIQHERLRYATDRAGVPWLFGDRDDLTQWIDELESLSKPVHTVWLMIRNLTS